MNKEMIGKIKIAVIVLVLCLIGWVFLLNPFIKFKSNEKKMLAASKRYFEINSHELPTGNRVATVGLKDLYSKAFLKNDLYVPLTNKVCSTSESFTKVKKVNGEYKYYVYLKCGVMSSSIDHKGPEIVLNGEDVIIINKNTKYKELGVKSVRDNTDGNMSVKSVSIDSSDVKVNKVGTYKVTYTVFDTFGNKTEKVRTVKVVSRLKNIVKNNTDKLGYYKGKDPKNYISFSGMLFRIVGIDGNNVKIIAEEDVSNVDYNGINKWLDYYYDHLTKESKKYIVDNKYCNMKINNETKNTKKCNSYTSKKKLYVISTDEINKSLQNDESFLKPASVSWTANKYNDKEAYTTRDMFIGKEYGQNVAKFDRSFTYGIRPVITIKGDTLIKKGTGSKTNPYSIGDFKVAQSNDKLNTRYTGEYIEYSNYLWRIIEVKDGRTKVILADTISSDQEWVETSYESKTQIYNPKEKGNVGYFFKNKISEYVKTNYFDKVKIEVPIYKNKYGYTKKHETKSYSVKLSAPNMYEIFSSYDFSSDMTGKYWFINSSKEKGRLAVMTYEGVPLNQKANKYTMFGIRPVGYLNRNVTIVNGSGTIEEPYIVEK
ncbi:MAG: DUF5011 domain-containing protein [Bacilli bacterium]|nr:DUF5011 domain-containing protein [Bacilli bacterium]